MMDAPIQKRGESFEIRRKNYDSVSGSSSRRKKRASFGATYRNGNDDDDGDDGEITTAERIRHARSLDYGALPPASPRHLSA